MNVFMWIHKYNYNRKDQVCFIDSFILKALKKNEIASQMALAIKPYKRNGQKPVGQRPYNSQKPFWPLMDNSITIFCMRFYFNPNCLLFFYLCATIYHFMPLFYGKAT